MAPAVDLVRIIREIREARYTHGILCPRCGYTHCVRWGGFAGRQRYRCRGCRRTFSDLTGTPAAYLKRLGEFALYRNCIRASVSVRRAARLIGVHKDTAFRWRHRVLDDVREANDPQLHGYVEITDARFPYLQKGRRRDRMRPQTGRRWRRLQQPAIWVTFVRDREHAAYAVITGNQRPGVAGMSARVRTQLADDVALLTSEGPMSAHVALANSQGLAACSRARHYDSQALLLHTDNVRTYVAAFRDWLVPFRGVSTRYLENYLAWFELLTKAERQHTCAELLHWPLPPPPSPIGPPSSPQPPSTLPADNGRRG